jgi:hypothetical protein
LFLTLALAAGEVPEVDGKLQDRVVTLQDQFPEPLVAVFAETDVEMDADETTDVVEAEETETETSVARIRDVEDKLADAQTTTIVAQIINHARTRIRATATTQRKLHNSQRLKTKLV